MILPHTPDYEVGHCFEYVLLSFESPPPRMGPFYLDLIISLAGFSVIFCFIAASHATREDLEVYGSTILHINNAWSKETNTSLSHNWYS